MTVTLFNDNVAGDERMIPPAIALSVVLLAEFPLIVVFLMIMFALELPTYNPPPEPDELGLTSELPEKTLFVIVNEASLYNPPPEFFAVLFETVT